MPASLRFSAGSYDLEELAGGGERILYGGWRDVAGGGRKACAGRACSRATRDPSRPRSPSSANTGLRDELDNAWAARPLELVREQDREPCSCSKTRGRLAELKSRRADGGRKLLAPRHCYRPGARECPRGRPGPQRYQAGPHPGQSRGRAAWLTGFGIASRLPRERQAPQPPEFIAGTLRLYGAGADRANEPLDRFPERPLRAWHDVLRNANREPCLYCF